MTQIEQGLAIAIAGQVSVGLTRGDGRLGRMEGALLAIGLMIKNAAQDGNVDDILALSEGAEIRQADDGSWRITAPHEL
jgi:hypothetical protein